MTDTGFNEPLQLNVVEKVVLHKYNGNYTQEQIDELQPEPVETIELVDGVVVSHWRKEDNI